MTVNTTTNSVQYTGDGTTTAFSFPYYFLADGDLVVYSDETLKTLTTDYTVTGAGVAAGGTVTYVTAPASGVLVTILRDPAITQATDWVENDPDPAEVKETAFDRLTMICQRLKDLVDRSLRLSDFEDLTIDMEVPTPVADNYLKWDSLGTGLTQAPASSGLADASSVTYTPSGTGAVATDVQTKLRESVSALDFMTPAERANVVAGTGDLSTAVQNALDSGENIHFPAGTYDCNAETIYSYPDQIVSGDGMNHTIFKTTNTSVAWAIADSSGIIDIATKDQSEYAFLRDFTIQNNGANSIGLRFAGVLRGGLSNIEVKKGTDEGAGSRTGYGIVIEGLNKAANRGCYYNHFENLLIRYQGVGLIYGARTNQNSPIINPIIHDCDDGYKDDDGTEFSFAAGNKAWGSQHIIDGGAIEVINNDAMTIASTATTICRNQYIDTVTGDAYVVSGSGGVIIIERPILTSITGNEVNHTAGSLTLLGPIPGYSDPASTRLTNLDRAIWANRLFDTSGTAQGASRPKIISGYITINGNDSDSFASGTVTFNGIGDLPTNIYGAMLSVQIHSTAAGGDGNSLYNAGYSGFTPFSSDTAFDVRIRRVDGAAISSTAAVVVRWDLLAYSA